MPKTKPDINNLLAQIRGLDHLAYAEFREHFIELDREKNRARVRKQLASFEVGQTVEFDARGRLARAVIQNIGTKRIICLEKREGQRDIRWRVSPSLCTVVQS